MPVGIQAPFPSTMSYECVLGEYSLTDYTNDDSEYPHPPERFPIGTTHVLIVNSSRCDAFPECTTHKVNATTQMERLEKGEYISTCECKSRHMRTEIGKMYPVNHVTGKCRYVQMYDQYKFWARDVIALRTPTAASRAWAVTEYVWNCPRDVVNQAKACISVFPRDQATLCELKWTRPKKRAKRGDRRNLRWTRPKKERNLIGAKGSPCCGKQCVGRTGRDVI